MNTICNISKERLNTSFSQMILSASGWRKIFAISGDEHDCTSEISDEDRLICTACAKTFVSVLGLNRKSKVLLARDSRMTGPNICEVIGRVLSYFGVEVCYAGICSAPEAMAESVYGSYQCFVYVSASHNPVGHNGIKIGANGGVFGADIVNRMIYELKKNIDDYEQLVSLYENSAHYTVCEDVSLKKQCLSHYMDFAKKTVCREGFFDDFAKTIQSMNIGIVADLNGSARSVSIDKEFLSLLGVKTCFINDKVGEIAHGIVPEGENLKPCCEFLEKMHQKDPSYCLGYVPDNDGDRGNLVYIDDNHQAKALKAQDVFALCVYSVLGAYSEKLLAVAVNCATSMRIDDIASSFNAKVYRAEVGEANVVNLADSLRKDGYCVPISGEGSNGGNIMYPSKVRDPINTLSCVLRILQYGTVEQLLNKLPCYTTTDAFSSDGVLRLKTKDYKNLKSIYEKNLDSEWSIMYPELSKYGIEHYCEFQTEGIVERRESGNGDKGGLKIVFYNKNNESIAFIWMRPSGTEPLFRVLADVKGNNNELHSLLINWQRSMILKAQNELLLK